MDTKEKIIILGFGRSGTTWISDIVSKMCGGLILFEPFHPEVYNKAKEACYHNGQNPELLNDIYTHTSKFDKKEISNKWLLRNHLAQNLNDVNDHFVNEVWNNCDVIGYKSIRQNFLIPELYENVSSKIVFLKRDILSVISSLIRRERFWEEFGFDFHKDKFIKETLDSTKYPFLKTTELRNLFDSLNEDYLKMTFLWVLTHVIVEQDLKKFNLPLFHYKDFYLDPYNTAKKLGRYLGLSGENIHPSYIFTPSMLTLRTFHKDENFNAEKKDLSIFWENTITIEMKDKILDLEKNIHLLVK